MYIFNFKVLKGGFFDNANYDLGRGYVFVQYRTI